jgi:hypothetical protein
MALSGPDIILRSWAHVEAKALNCPVFHQKRLGKKPVNLVFLKE